MQEMAKAIGKNSNAATIHRRICSCGSAVKKNGGISSPMPAITIRKVVAKLILITGCREYRLVAICSRRFANLRFSMFSTTSTSIMRDQLVTINPKSEKTKIEKLTAARASGWAWKKANSSCRLTDCCTLRAGMLW